MKPEIRLSSSLSADFRWTDRETASPCSFGGELGGTAYLLSDFNALKTYAAVESFDSVAQMLVHSVKLYGEETVVFREWLCLWRLCHAYPGAFAALCPPHMSKNYEEVFSAADLWPASLTDYLSGKAQLWKSALLIAKMPHLAGYTAGFAAKNPSVQQFRSFVETVRDFSDVLEGEYDAEKHLRLTEKISPQHREALRLLNELKNAASPVSLTQQNNFETGEILWSFSASAPEELEKVIEKLNAALPALKRYAAAL